MWIFLTNCNKTEKEKLFTNIFFIIQESDEEECFKDQEEVEESEETFVDADKVEGEERSATENSAKTNHMSSAASWVHHENMGGKLARKHNAFKS